MSDKNKSHPTLLIVDDVPQNVSVLIDFLSDQELDIRVAENGESALKQLEFVYPDLILMDVQMPGIDGLETCRRIKQLKDFRDIPIIFMTSLTETSDKLAGFEAGGVDYVTKPFEPEEILARVNAHLRLRELSHTIEARSEYLEQEVKRRKDAELRLQSTLEHALILCDANGKIQFCTEQAWALLETFFEKPSFTNIPSQIEDWMKRENHESTWESAKNEKQLSLTVRMSARKDTDESICLTLNCVAPPARPQDLETLGLTPKESEILFWLSQGKTNAEIATILESALNTVKKHVQNIFQKLGLETRTAATRLALETIEGLGKNPFE